MPEGAEAGSPLTVTVTVDAAMVKEVVDRLEKWASGLAFALFPQGEKTAETRVYALQGRVPAGTELRPAFHYVDDEVRFVFNKQGTLVRGPGKLMPVQVAKGPNTIGIVLVNSGSGETGFHLSITDPRGRPLMKDLKIKGSDGFVVGEQVFRRVYAFHFEGV